MSFSDLVDKKLKEEAKSKSQRRLMGWARACEKGEADDCPERVKNVAKSFTDKAELKKYAKTKEKGLPEKVDEAYGYRPTSRDDADEYGDWKMHQRQDQELDRRWEEEQAKKNQDVEENEGDEERWEEEAQNEHFLQRVAAAVQHIRNHNERPHPYTVAHLLDMDMEKLVKLLYHLADNYEGLTRARAMEYLEMFSTKNLMKPDHEMNEGEAYGAEKWDDYEGDEGVEDEMIAWTGGSAPPKYADMDIRTKKLVRRAYQQQIGEYTSGWGEEPDEGTKQIFWNRAMHDAWASTRHQNEDDMTLADLDHENVLTEGPLAVEPGDAGPDKEWKPRFEPQPKDAGAPTWHEPKARWETIKHRDSLRGVINVGTRPEMKNKAYTNGEHNKPKMSTVVYDESRKIRVNHPTKGNGTVLKIFEGAVLIEWDSLNLRPLGPETLSKDEAQYVTIIENYAKDPEAAEMGPKPKKKDDDEKDEVNEDQYEQQPSFQVAPPPSMTIFQDQETDDDWSADPLATQRGADAAGDGEGPEGEMEEPEDAPDDLNIDHQELPDSGRAEQIAGEVFKAFDGEGGTRNEIDYKSDQVDFEKQSDSSHNKEDGGESDSEDSGSEEKQAFPARDKSEDKDDDSEEKDTERDDSESDDDSDDDSDEEKKKTDESLSLKDFDIEGILD